MHRRVPCRRAALAAAVSLALSALAVQAATIDVGPCTIEGPGDAARLGAARA